MRQTRKPFRVDLIVFYVCCMLGSWWFGFEVGRYQQPPMQCAKVLGLTPVSSTATECTYVMGGTMGKAYWKFLAEREAKK